MEYPAAWPKWFKPDEPNDSDVMPIVGELSDWDTHMNPLHIRSQTYVTDEIARGMDDPQVGDHLGPEVAHLPKTDEGFGFVTDEHRQVMRHTVATAASGVTEGYIGGHSRELYNERAANQGRKHQREPVFSSESAWDVVKARISPEEVQEWKTKNPKDAGLSRRQIFRRIRRDWQDTFQRTAVADLHPSKKHRPDAANNDLTTEVPDAANNDLTTEVPDAANNDLTTEVPDAANNDLTMEVPDAANNDLTTEVSGAVSMNIERVIFPQVQEEDASPPEGDDNSPLTEEAQRLILGSGESQTALDFIQRYSHINIVKCNGFALAWQRAKADPSVTTDLGLYSMSGNSRDGPVPFLFRCGKTAGCTYQSVESSCVARHEKTCKPRGLLKLVEQCPYEGCDWRGETNGGLHKHISNKHEWVPKTCSRVGCDATIAYKSMYFWSKHLKTHRV